MLSFKYLVFYAGDSLNKSLMLTLVAFYCRTCFSMGDLGVQFPSVCLSVRSSVRQHLP